MARRRKKDLPLQKVIVVGLGAVGKSSLTLRFMYDNFEDDYDPTAADSYRKKIKVDDIDMHLDVLDTAGQDEYAAMRDSYYRTGEGFLVVYAINDRKTFEELGKFYEQICRVTERTDLPFVVVANKCDLEDQRQVTTAEGEAWAKEKGFPFFEASAKANINVDEGFMALVRGVIDSKSATNRDPKCIIA